METALGIIVGGLITLCVSWLFYVRAAKELRIESVNLRRRIDLVLTGLGNAGIVELSRNEEGEIVGISVTVRPSTIATTAQVHPTTPDVEGEAD